MLARGGVDAETGEAWVRPYTPMDGAAVGRFALNVRVYERGKLSRHLAALPVGETVDFHAPPPRLYRARFVAAAARVGVVCAGTGITTAFQALERVLRKGVARSVALLYGSRTAASILYGAALADLEAAHRGVLAVTHCLSREPPGSPWTGARGRVDRALLKKTLPPPGPDVLVYVCGPAGLVDALCGPPDDGDRPARRRRNRGLLAGLGYARDAVCRL